MVEINLKNKSRLFGKYCDQELIIIADDGRFEDCFINLNLISSITDEDTIEVAKLMGLTEGDFEITHRTTDIHINSYSQEFTLLFENCSIYFNDFDTYSANTGIDYLSAYDFLRSKGYALPWMGLSVEEMVQAGWIKLA